MKKVESTVAGFKKDLKDINNLAHYDDIKVFLNVKFICVVN